MGFLLGYVSPELPFVFQDFLSWPGYLDLPKAYLSPAANSLLFQDFLSWPSLPRLTSDLPSVTGCKPSYVRKYDMYTCQ